MQFRKGTPFVLSGLVPGKEGTIVSELKTWAKERNIEITEEPPVR